MGVALASLSFIDNTLTSINLIVPLGMMFGLAAASGRELPPDV